MQHRVNCYQTLAPQNRLTTGLEQTPGVCRLLGKLFTSALKGHSVCIWKGRLFLVRKINHVFPMLQFLQPFIADVLCPPSLRNPLEYTHEPSADSLCWRDGQQVTDGTDHLFWPLLVHWALEMSTFGKVQKCHPRRVGRALDWESPLCFFICEIRGGWHGLLGVLFILVLIAYTILYAAIFIV